MATGCLTGVYFDPEHDMHHSVFLCRSTASDLPRPSSPEISACLYWDPASLPRPISDFTIRRIEDALKGADARLITIGPRHWIQYAAEVCAG